jgi:hypothetical protein
MWLPKIKIAIQDAIKKEAQLQELGRRLRQCLQGD